MQTKPRSLAARSLLVTVAATVGLFACNSPTSDTPAGNSGGTTGHSASGPLAKPCDYFTDEVAGLLVPGPFSEGRPTLAPYVSNCARSQSTGKSSAFARFQEASSLAEFKDSTCKGLPEVKGLGLYACSVGELAISMLTPDGKWNIQVGNAPLENCKAALLSLADKLK